MKNIIFIFLFLVSFNLFAQKKLPNVDIIYSQSASTLHPKYTLFVSQKDSISLYFKLNLKEFNFVVLDKHKLKAKIKIKYIFYNSLENTNILDSASRVFSLTKNKINSSFVSYFEIPKPDSNSFLVIITEDLYNNNKTLSFLEVDVSNSSSERFMIMDASTHTPVFFDYVNNKKTYFVKTDLNIDSLKIQRFNYDTTMPLPPFSSFKKDFFIISDSIYNIGIDENFKFEKNYIYKISTLDGSVSKNIICFDNTYPYIIYSYQLLYPMKYLTTNEEFQNLKSYPNLKLAIDDFWLTISDNRETVRNMLKIYYNRIQLSNYYFTEDKPGWMTDRGMIYTIFGPPVSLYKGDNFEEWLYFNPFSYKKESFYFAKKYDDLGIEKYILKRNSLYLKYWRDAIDSWRKGVFYSF